MKKKMQASATIDCDSRQHSFLSHLRNTRLQFSSDDKHPWKADDSRGTLNDMENLPVHWTHLFLSLSLSLTHTHKEKTLVTYYLSFIEYISKIQRTEAS